MILKSNRASIFLPTKAFRECEARGKLPLVKRNIWVFVLTKETLYKVKYPDALCELSSILKIETHELFQILLKEVEEYKRPCAILCEDGVFIHPEIFGKLVLKIAKRKA